MAKRQLVQLIDDLDGEALGDDGRTVTFGLDGKTFEIDLSTSNIQALRAALVPFVKAARVIPRTRRARAR